MTGKREITRVLAENQGFVVFGTFLVDPVRPLDRASTPELHVMYLGPGLGLLTALNVEWQEDRQAQAQTRHLFTQVLSGETALLLDASMLGAWSKDLNGRGVPAGALTLKGTALALTLHGVGPMGQAQLKLNAVLHWLDNGSRFEDTRFSIDLSPR